MQRKRLPWASAELCSVHQPVFFTQYQGRAARCKCSLNLHTFSYLIIPPVTFSYIWCFPCMEHFRLFFQGSFYIYLHIEDWCESGSCVVGGRLVPDCFVLITTHIDFQPTSLQFHLLYAPSTLPCPPAFVVVGTVISGAFFGCSGQGKLVCFLFTFLDCQCLGFNFLQFALVSVHQKNLIVTQVLSSPFSYPCEFISFFILSVILVKCLGGEKRLKNI